MIDIIIIIIITCRPPTQPRQLQWSPSQGPRLLLWRKRWLIIVKWHHYRHHCHHCHHCHHYHHQGLFHFVFGALPQQILLHFPNKLCHFPNNFASVPQQFCFISPTICFISPTIWVISPTIWVISPTHFLISPTRYCVSLLKKYYVVFNQIYIFPSNFGSISVLYFPTGVTSQNSHSDSL